VFSSYWVTFIVFISIRRYRIINRGCAHFTILWPTDIVRYRAQPAQTAFTETLNMYSTAAFDKQCGQATIIKSFNHVNGRPVRDRTLLVATALTTNKQDAHPRNTHLQCHCCPHWRNFLGGLASLVWASASLHQPCKSP